MSLTWYVRLGGNVVGWVIAANEVDAVAASLVKYPGWGLKKIAVLSRRR